MLEARAGLRGADQRLNVAIRSGQDCGRKRQYLVQIRKFQSTAVPFDRQHPLSDREPASEQLVSCSDAHQS